MRRSIVAALVLSLALSAAALAQTRTPGHTMDPPMHGQFTARVAAGTMSCDQAAQNLAQAFESAQSGLTNVTGTCDLTSSFAEEGQTYRMYTLTVNFDASDYVNVSTTQFSPDVLWDTTPVYSDYASCLADIDSQSRLFQKATSLVPLTVSCALLNDEDSGYEMDISALGTTNARLYSFVDRTVDLDSDATSDVAWSGAIAHDIASQGAIVAKQAGMTTYYYSSQPVLYSSETLEVLPDMVSCNSQLDQARKILAAAGAADGAAVCKMGAASVSMNLRGSFADARLSDDYGATSPVFHSLDECVQSRSELLSQAGSFAVGGICAPGDGQGFQLHVISYR